MNSIITCDGLLQHSTTIFSFFQNAKPKINSKLPGVGWVRVCKIQQEIDSLGKIFFKLLEVKYFFHRGSSTSLCIEQLFALDHVIISNSM